MKISLNELRAINLQALQLYGYAPREMEILLDIILYAQLRGNIQSLLQFAYGKKPQIHQAQPITMERETHLSALLNGHGQNGMLLMHKAMEIAHVKAKEHGFSIVGTKGGQEGTGAIGYYVNHLARQGYIGWACSGSSKRVAPYGSYQPLFGTNPLAIGIPTLDEPIVLDMATSAIPFFKVVEAQLFGKPLPHDVAYDSQGHLSDNPADAIHGALRSMDLGPRGSGLALIVEALTGPLVNAVIDHAAESGMPNYGNLIFAIDPDLLIDRLLFKQQMSQLKEAVKSSKKLPHIQEIFVAGELSQRHAKEALELGYLEIDDQIYHLFMQKLKNLQIPSTPIK
jgi:L-2-hydroxycarboxylate dehydrogenase (NAD+)